MIRRLILLLAAAGAIGSATGVADPSGIPETSIPGLSQREGRLYLNGKPYRGVGANYFDLFLRVLHDPTNTTSLAGLKRLGEAGIPFVRFAVAYGEKDWRVFFDDRAEFFRRMDLVVRAAERANVGLIPSIFWHFVTLPDLAGEPRDQWGNPRSETHARMRLVVGEIVKRYRDSPAVWAWEFGNEPNLAADLPNAAQFRKKGGTERDDLKSADMVVMLEEFAKEVRRHDDRRLLLSGHSHPRASAWHNTAEKSWKADSREQTLEILRRDNPAPLDTVGIHIYAGHAVEKELAGWATNHLQYLEEAAGVARGMKRPLWVGEFGLGSKGDEPVARRDFGMLIDSMEKAGVDLAAFWVFDLKSQDGDWNVTFDNDRAFMLKLAADANRRWNALAAATNGLPPAAGRASGAGRPNILFMIADDLGYGDTGCYGSTKIRTPNIDRLAAQGVRFTDAHSVAAVCNPSRYSILSGTYLWHAKRKNDYSLYFHDGQVTLPSLLKSAGYRTAALGKWHNGFGRGGDPDYNAELKPGPLEIGFDSFFGTPRTHNEPPFVFVENHRVVGHDPADPIVMVAAKDTKEGWNHGISKGAAAAHAARPVDRIDLILTERAEAFLGQSDDRPFFLYLAFLAPHVPIAPSPGFRGTSGAGAYGDFIQQLDHCAGRVLDALEARGLAANTLVMFTSDNGAVLTREALAAGHRSNGALLGQKTDAWEGGHRVPFIARWPGRIPAGTVRAELFSQVDVMATLAEAAGVALPPGASPDGASGLAAFLDPAGAPARRTEAVFLGTGGHALRQGEWLFMPRPGSGGMTVRVPAGAPWGQPYAKMGLVNSDVDDKGAVKPGSPDVQLYNLREDVGQRRNLAAGEKPRAETMRKRLESLVGPARSASLSR